MRGHQRAEAIEVVVEAASRSRVGDGEDRVVDAGVADPRRQRRVEVAAIPAEAGQQPRRGRPGRGAATCGSNARERRGETAALVAALLTGTVAAAGAENDFAGPVAVGSATAVAIVAWPQNGTSASGLK